MKFNIRGWQPSRWNWRLIGFLGIMLALILAVGIGLGVSQKTPSHATSPKTTTSTSIGAASTKPTVSSAPPTVSVATIANLLKLADPAVKIYGSYPNSQGKTVLINQLRSLVSPAALASIKRQWSGPEITTASNTVTDLQYGQIAYTSPAMLSIDMTVYIKGKTVFTETPTTAFDVPVTVRFIQSGGQWVISNITTPDFPSN